MSRSPPNPSVPIKYNRVPNLRSALSQYSEGRSFNVGLFHQDNVNVRRFQFKRDGQSLLSLTLLVSTSILVVHSWTRTRVNYFNNLHVPICTIIVPLHQGDIRCIRSREVAETCVSRYHMAQAKTTQSHSSFLSPWTESRMHLRTISSLYHHHVRGGQDNNEFTPLLLSLTSRESLQESSLSYQTSKGGIIIPQEVSIHRGSRSKGDSVSLTLAIPK